MKPPRVLVERLHRLGINLDDIVESFARSSGPGGQHVNKVSTAVTLRHAPSDITVTAQESRSQATNRRTAWLRLVSALEEQRRIEMAARRAIRERERRRKSPRPARLKERILVSKHKRGELKRQRAQIIE